MAVQGLTERLPAALRWYPIWCVLRTLILSAVTALIWLALGYDSAYIWANIALCCLMNVWWAANERPVR